MARRAILIVGEDKVFCDSCAKILRDWKTTTTDSTGAPLAVLGRVWDLLILCETVEDCDARQIVSQAKGLYPDLRFFAISHRDRGLQMGIPTFEAVTFRPYELRDAVASLMRADSRQPSFGVLNGDLTAATLRLGCPGASLVQFSYPRSENGTQQAVYVAHVPSPADQGPYR